jgi:hypothetical protein
MLRLGPIITTNVTSVLKVSPLETGTGESFHNVLPQNDRRYPEAYNPPLLTAGAAISPSSMSVIYKCIHCNQL